MSNSLIMGFCLRTHRDLKPRKVPTGFDLGRTSRVNMMIPGLAFVFQLSGLHGSLLGNSPRSQA